MTPTGLAHHAGLFQAAIQAHDFQQAQTALYAYVECFQSRARQLPEVEAARDLLQWGVQTAKAHKAQMAEEFMLLKRVVDAYGSPRRSNTWRLDG
jgi:hypothetical protein